MPSLAPFADIEALINQGVEQHLANATATFNGGEPFAVLFDRVASDPFGNAIDTARTVVAFSISRAPGIETGSEISIGGVLHTVASQVQPDASGWLQLDVYPQA